ncbi:MAG: extracellular solute-binding protein [Planctomycetota bacterium]
MTKADRRLRARGPLMFTAAIAWCAAWLAGCSGEADQTSDASGQAQQRVVLYSSVDDYLLREVVSAFEADTGIAVDVVGDTEATKTTGLMQRVLAERDDPQADVWWSSEPFATIRLAREDALAEMPEREGHPEDLRAQHWLGFGLRARVIAYDTRKFESVDDVPRTLADLTKPEFRGRVAIARPEFGTTRGHLAALVEAWGEEPTEAWLEAMVANDMRVYSSNSAVVRAIADGEVWLALTDTDDVWSGQQNDWPVDLVYEATDESSGGSQWQSFGPMLIPNTIAYVSGSEDDAAARTLVDYVLSERATVLMAESDSRNIPIDAELRARYQQWSPIPAADGSFGWSPDLDAVEAQVPTALELSERHLN